MMEMADEAEGGVMGVKRKNEEGEEEWMVSAWSSAPSFGWVVWSTLSPWAGDAFGESFGLLVRDCRLDDWGDLSERRNNQDNYRIR